MNEPILGKREPTNRDYRPITWDAFLALRSWAKDVAAKYGAQVYLVGSALDKTEPRDIDLAIVLPLAEFETRYGPIPPTLEYDAEGVPFTSPERIAYIDRLYGRVMNDRQSAHAVTGGRYTIDVKLCPDSWWPEKDRLLLAAA